MRWPLYFILAYLMLGLQLGLGGFMAIGGVEPNLLLLVIVFMALTAPRDEALIGALLLGAMQDLVSLEPMGLYAFAYGLVAVILVGLAEMVERRHPLTYLGAAAVGGIVWAAVLLVRERLHPAGPAIVEPGATIGAVRVSARAVLGAVLYTTLLAPLVLGVLQWMQQLLQIDAGRRTLRR